MDPGVGMPGVEGLEREGKGGLLLRDSSAALYAASIVGSGCEVGQTPLNPACKVLFITLALCTCSRGRHHCSILPRQQKPQEERQPCSKCAWQAAFWKVSLALTMQRNRAKLKHSLSICTRECIDEGRALSPDIE